MDMSNRADHLYHFPLYSCHRFFACFLKYAKKHALEVSQKYGGFWLYYYLDMIWCNIRYGAMDSRDYLLFEFYKKSAKERNSYLTKRRYFRLIRTFNNEVFSRMLDKDYVNKEYADFVHRHWVKVSEQTTDEEICDFISKHERVIVKPLSSEQGHGIFKVSYSDTSKVSDFLKSRKGDYLLEEVLENHPLLEKINSSSLNTVRVYTLIDRWGKVHVLSSFLRVGCGGVDVDNWGSGGVGYHIDNHFGIIDDYGRDKKGNLYLSHPSSGVLMVGFQIPNYPDLLDFAKSVALKQPLARFCGLDIAVLPKGFALVEINFPGGHDFLQAFGIGFYDVIKRIY